MRLLFIHPFLFRYARGVERFTLSLSSALARRGVDVDLLTWRWPDRIQVADLDPRVRVYTIPTSRYYAAQCAVPFYAAHLLTHRYDFVWIYFAGYGEAEALTLAGRLRPLTYGVTFHYPYAQAPYRYHEFERYALARRAARLVTVSSFVADSVRERFGREPIVIRSAADTSHFTPDPSRRASDRASLKLDPDAKVVLTVAALEERKGIQYLIRALPQVVAAHPELRYIVLGEGPYRPALESLIREHGLDRFVELRGTTSDMYLYYNSADLFALLSIGEGLPAAPLEAMAMELPLLTSDQRPFDELVEPTYGLAVPPSNSDGVAAALFSFLDVAERRRAMGKAARARALADFTYDAMAARYIDLCRTAAAVPSSKSLQVSTGSD